MDQFSFDRIARLLGASGTRRQGLGALISTALGFGAAALDSAAADAQPARSQRPETEGPCGNGKRKDNQCTRDSQCCTGICDVSKGKKNKDKKGRCRCLKNGKPCAADKNCCKSSVCFDGSCTDCRKSNQSCFDSGDCCGTGICSNYICIPCRNDGQSCSASADCCSGFACYDGTCAPCASVGTTCTADSQCCDGSLCLDGVCSSCIPEGGSCGLKLTAASHGEPREFALDCCGSLLCHNGACVAPQSVKNGDPCIAGYDTCKDPDASCTNYRLDSPDGTYCLLPWKARCTADAECDTNDCLDNVCIACSHPACTTTCSPIVCKSGCTYSTVQAAIDAAANNALIDIGAGTYTEDLVCAKDITLRACKGEEVILRNQTFGSRTIQVNDFFDLTLIDIIVDARNDPENEIWGGGIATLGQVGLFRNTIIRNGAWEYGGGIMIGGPEPIPIGFAPKRASGVGLGSRLSSAMDRGLSATRVTNPEGAARHAAAPAITPANYIGPTYLIIADQAIVEQNSAKYFGGGIFFSYEGLPTSLNPSFPFFPFVVIAVSGQVRDNQVTSTTAPRIPNSLQTVTLTTYGGGGIFAVNSISIILHDAHVHRNIADWYGGGIMQIPVLGPTPESVVMDDNARISGNRSWRGGGAALLQGVGQSWQGVLMQGDSTIADNIAEADGGGVYLEGVPLWMEDASAITGNSAGAAGGGAITVGPYPQDSYGGFYMGDDAVISANTADRGAGALLVANYGWMDGDAAITGNTAEGDGGGIYLAFLDVDTGFNSVLFMNESAGISGNIAGNGVSGDGGGVYSDNVLNGVIGGNLITANNPNDCVGSSSPSCIA